MSDNPFNDEDRTVIRPAPGGRRTPPSTAAPAAAAPPRMAAPVAAAPMDDTLTLPGIGTSPLLSAAQPLLQLIGRLRNTVSQPDPGELRERAVAAMRRFEQEARGAGVPMEQLRPAHYALCAGLDDVVLNTPWGSQGGWANRSLISTFHQEVQAGERFFALLQKLQQSPGTSLPVLELMYVILALGFQGRYRLSPRGPAELDRVREELYAIITRQRGATPDPELSARWHGVAAPYRPARARVPIWVMASAVAAMLGGLFVWLSGGLESQTDGLLARAQAAPPAAMPQIARVAPVRPPPPPPPPAAPPAPGTLDKLRAFLAPEIQQGIVAVLGTDAAPLIRIRNRGMFPSGSATLSQNFLPIMTRIGEALRDEPGPVLVIGHSDNQPIRTVRFPSNFALSAARAEAARDAILRGLGDPARISFEGRADTEPVADNNTAEGREANRRIEVLLRREGR
ncbi:type VI secretion system protein TssL, long form [Roseomonas sp. AR75]|uniref:type VI secretion system protein TssL, long form n=1 Tax=Roseomonas sp. AR75 TaxID=2562311 RepID=UPI0010C01933|nr:type VI secretion system protein TssL, long form [Roseomonas sp. AR75]